MTMTPAIIHCDEEDVVFPGCIGAIFVDVAINDAPQCLQTEAHFVFACVQAGQYTVSARGGTATGLGGATGAGGGGAGLAAAWSAACFIAFSASTSGRLIFRVAPRSGACTGAGAVGAAA